MPQRPLPISAGAQGHRESTCPVSHLFLRKQVALQMFDLVQRLEPIQLQCDAVGARPWPVQQGHDGGPSRHRRFGGVGCRRPHDTRTQYCVVEHDQVPESTKTHTDGVLILSVLSHVVRVNVPLAYFNAGKALPPSATRTAASCIKMRSGVTSITPTTAGP